MSIENVIIKNEQEHDRAIKLARGSYQYGLLMGYNRWSGADLRGKAREYSGRYARSRHSLLERMKAAGIKHRLEYIGPHRKLVLIIG